MKTFCLVLALICALAAAFPSVIHLETVNPLALAFVFFIVYLLVRE